MPPTEQYLLKDGKPVIVCYCIRSQFDALVASTGPNRQNFTLVWASGEDSNADKWGWQLVPSAGAIASTNSVFVTSSIKWNSTIPDSWRKSQAWLDYSFSVANRSQPAFVIVGSFDDIPERNAWLEADTTGCTNGMQMHDITGRINSTNYYHRVHQWILGTPSANPGGYVPDGCYVVTNLSSGKSLNMPNSVGTNYGYAGLQLVQSTPGTSLDNYFMFYHLGTNIYRIISLDSGLALEAPNNNAGAQIAQDWESTGTSQRWTVVYAGNGSYYLQNQASGKVLDVGRAITNGAPVLQNSMTNGVAGQQWTLGLVARIGSPPPPLLTARQAGEAVRLSWPLGYASYTLQKQSGISGVSSGPGAWLDVAGVVSNSYSEPLTNLNCFYRLKSQ